MTQDTASHSPHGSNAAPQLIHLSDEQAAELSSHMSGGSFLQRQTNDSLGAQGPPHTTHHLSQKATQPYGSTPITATQPRPADRDPSVLPGIFGVPAEAPVVDGHDSSAHYTGSTSARLPHGQIGSSAGAMGQGKRLPELWWLDLILSVCSATGVVLILINLPLVLLSIAQFVYVLLEFLLQIAIVVAIGACLVFALRRRRRRW